MTILALDQASKVTGWAVFIDNKLADYGHFSLDNLDIGKRLVAFRNKLLDLINKYSPDEVIYEDIQYQANKGNNVQTFKILAEVYGIVTETLSELQIPHQSVLSVTWKSTLAIKGKDRAEQKRNAQAYVTKTYSTTPTQDECDAICIGEHYCKQSNTQGAW